MSSRSVLRSESLSAQKKIPCRPSAQVRDWNRRMFLQFFPGRFSMGQKSSALEKAGLRADVVKSAPRKVHETHLHTIAWRGNAGAMPYWAILIRRNRDSWSPQAESRPLVDVPAVSPSVAKQCWPMTSLVFFWQHGLRCTPACLLPTRPASSQMVLACR